MESHDQNGGAVGIPWAQFRVPPFPATALRALELVDEEGASIQRLSDLISSDAAFSSEVLTIANSALVAHRLSVTSILQAIATLGTRNLKGVCLTVGVRAFLGKSMSYPPLRAIWRHSLACALVSEMLALAGFMDKDAAYTGGVMHEIGRFALAVIRPKEYAALLETHCGSATSILEPERELFGFDHCEAGRHLVTEWELPRSFETFISRRESARQKDDPWHMADLIHMSCRMADAAGFSAFAGCEVTPYSELLDELPLRERSLFHADIKGLASEVANKINVIESL